MLFSEKSYLEVKGRIVVHFNIVVAIVIGDVMEVDQPWP